MSFPLAHDLFFAFACALGAGSAMAAGIVMQPFFFAWAKSWIRDADSQMSFARQKHFIESGLRRGLC